MTEEDVAAFAAFVWGRTVAHDMLIRGLYTKLAMQHEDPQRFIVDTIEGLVGQLDALDEAATPLAVKAAAVEHLEDVLTNVRTRLAGLGYPARQDAA